jgi:hypothetical protein
LRSYSRLVVLWRRLWNFHAKAKTCDYQFPPHGIKKLSTEANRNVIATISWSNNSRNERILSLASTQELALLEIFQGLSAEVHLFGRKYFKKK